jgi:hypothetical protein
MRIAFCTTCKGRAEHLIRTLPQNLSDNRDYEDARFVLLDYRNSRDGLAEYVVEKHPRELTCGKLVMYRYPLPGPFEMAHSKNLAHRLAILEGAEVLVNLDADNYTGPGFARYVSDQVSRSRDAFLWARMIKQGPNRLPRGCNGRIAVHKQAFLNAGGYDEKFTTWSPDDKDFNARLRRLGYHGLEIDRQFLGVILHNDKMRFREYPEAERDGAKEENFAEVENSSQTIANWGKFGLGTVYRNFDPKPVEVAPVPTRIFGIGLHKTATTSLHEALTILGYQSAHWVTAHWAKAIWDEMKTEGRSRTLEKHYALCDLPIPLLYRELDGAYPGSKFILTIRSEADWLVSVEKHFSWKNPHREQWDHDPFSHRAHLELYGRRKYDETIFRDRYRRHIVEVLEYFRDRPNDLLVMNMNEGAGWYELCGFLKQPIPAVDYPWRNANV